MSASCVVCLLARSIGPVRKLSGVARIVLDVDGAELNRQEKVADITSGSCRNARAKRHASSNEVALRRKFSCVAFAFLWVSHSTPPLISQTQSITMKTMQKTATIASQSDLIA